jgi:hypothetical protein
MKKEGSNMVDAITDQGESVLALSRKKPVLLVFLRQFGCPFCREAMTDLSEQRRTIEAQGIEPILVHMTSEQYARQILGVYELGDLQRVSDPEQVFYKSFGLERGNIWQIFGFKTLWRMMDASLLNGHLLGKKKGDQYQMPGVFLLEDGEVKDSFKHRNPSDRPSYIEMARPDRTSLYA